MKNGINPVDVHFGSEFPDLTGPGDRPVGRTRERDDLMPTRIPLANHFPAQKSRSSSNANIHGLRPKR
jgi:hypothetical protein